MSNEPSFLNTKEFASLYLVKPESVRSKYCLSGSYCGVVPIKLPNGRLGWPVDKKLN